MSSTNLTNISTPLNNNQTATNGTFTFKRIYFVPTFKLEYIVPLIMIILLTGISGIIGNSMVFYLERKRRKKMKRSGPRPLERSMSIYFIKSLALSDLLSCIIHTPLGCFWLLFDSTIKNDLECKLHRVALMSLSCITILNVTFIAIERYLAVFYPLRAPSVAVSKVCVILAWVFGTVVGIAHILPYKAVSIDIGQYAYTVICIPYTEKQVGQVLMTVHTVIMYLIPNIIMLVSSILISRFLRKRKRQISDGIVNATEKSQAWRFKDTGMFVKIMFAFSIPYSLFFVVGILKEAGVVKFNFVVELFIQKFTFILAFTNCAINPIIYITGSKDLKSMTRKMFTSSTVNTEKTNP